MIVDTESIYRKVIWPSIIHKDTLLLAIDSIKSLQDYERIKTLRKEKYQLLDLGKDRISELHKNLLKLKESIPKAKIKKEKPMPTKKHKKKEVHYIEPREPKLSSLDLELERIKHKLESLNI